MVDLIADGCRLFPVEGKIPLVKDWPALASNRKEQIAAWEKQFPACNWGLATGPGSGVFVVDFDGEQGLASGRAWSQDHDEDWTQTRMAKTARGYHAFFRWPLGDFKIRNSASKLAPGVDVRGDGGYVVVPPSIHPSGVAYEWLNDLPIADPPDWLLSLIIQSGSSKAETARARESNEETKIPAGQRTPVLFSLAGTMRARGMDATAIEAALRLHNEAHCDPPLPSEKIHQLAIGVCRYTPDPTVETVTVNELGRADMPREVLDGRLGEICERYMQDAPLAYAWPALVTIAGASPWLKHSCQEIRSNLYGCLVGDVGTGKTAVFERALHVLSVAPLDPLILSAKYGSAEGLANELKGKGSCVRLLAPDELAHLLRKCAIEHSSFPTFLTSAFNQDRQKGGTKKDEFEVDCRLSIFGGVVEDDFGDCFGAATTCGLYDRMLFGLCPQPYEYEYYPPKRRAATFSVSPPKIDGSVWEVRNEWRKAGISGRVAEIALRVAFICAAADGQRVLRGVDLQPALALAEYQMKVRAVLQPNSGKNPDAQCGISIMNWLRANAGKGEWVKRRDLGRGVHYSRVGAGVFNRALFNLQMNDSIELEPKQKTVRLGAEEL